MTRMKTEGTKSIETLEDSGIKVQIESTDKNYTDDDHEKNESIEPLEDSESDVEIDPIDEDHKKTNPLNH